MGTLKLLSAYLLYAGVYEGFTTMHGSFYPHLSLNLNGKGNT